MTVLAPCVVDTVIFPDRVSWVLGLKVTFIVWVWPGVSVTGRVTPLVVVSVALAVTCEIVKFVFPLLVSVTLCELELPALTLPNARPDGFADRTVVLVTPAPLRAMLIG